MKFGAILADPPWSFKVWSDKGKGKSAERHYPVMTSKDIMNLPVKTISKKDSCLFLWVIDSMLIDGLKTMKKWGFEYKTVAFTWIKTNKSLGFFMGTGYWTRANPEMCLLGTRGKPKRLDRGVRQLIVSPRRKHSQKPDEMYSRIEALVKGPYIELFARKKRKEWMSWGNEIESDIKLKRRRKSDG